MERCTMYDVRYSCQRKSAIQLNSVGLTHAHPKYTDHVPKSIIVYIKIDIILTI